MGVLRSLNVGVIANVRSVLFPRVALDPVADCYASLYKLYVNSLIVVNIDRADSSCEREIYIILIALIFVKYAVI